MPPSRTPEARRRYNAAYKKRKIAADPNWLATNREKMKQWRLDNPDAARINTRRHRARYKYGVTLDDIEARRVAQNNKCAVCTDELSVRYHVDHCHASGRVRGLLCHLCNPGLGMFKDDPDRLLRAIEYLRLHVQQ